MEDLYEIDEAVLEAVVGENKIAKLEAEYVKNRSAAALQQLTKLSKMGKYDMKSLRKKMKQISETDQIELDEKRKKKKKKKAKRDACYHKVRARYDVWPSAYASGALVKCRKVGAANWGNKSKKKESIEFDDTLLQIIQEEYQAVLDEKKKKRKKRKGGKKDGKGASSKGYTLRDWFKGDGWVQTGGKYDGKPCAKQPGQKTKPYCRDPDDRAKMSKKERDKRAAKKRKEDPNPDRRGKAKNVKQKKGKKK